MENQPWTTEHRVTTTSHEIGRIQNMTSEQFLTTQEDSKIFSWTGEGAWLKQRKMNKKVWDLIPA